LNIALLYLLFGVVAGLDNVTDVFISTFDARQEVWKSQVARVLQNIAGGGITIGLVFISPTVLMAGIGYAAQYGVKFAVAGYLGRVYPWGRVRKSLFKRYWSFALPNMLASMVGFVYMHVDRLLLKGLAGAEAVGYLYGSQKFAKLLLMVSGATLNLVMTEASELHSMGKEQELQRLANQSQKYLSLLTAPMIAGLVIFAEPLVVTVLGADYLPSVIVLQLLGVQVFGMTISRPLGMMLYGIDRPGLGSTFSVITLAVGVGLTFMLVPDTLLGAPMVGLGVVGVAVSLGVRGLLSWGLLAFTLRYLANIQIYLRPIWHLAGAFSVTGAAYYLLHAQSAVVQLVTAPIIVAPLYTGFLYLVNEAGQKEFNVLLRALNLKPLGS
jgi:O-antigen/teichoic acid export membrane protein